MSVADTARFAAALSTTSDTAAAVAECCASVRETLGGAPDLLFSFVTPGREIGNAELEIPTRIQEGLGARHALGCFAGGVLAGGDELEGRPGVAMFGARLPGATIDVLHLQDADLPGPDAPPSAWIERIGHGPDDVRGFIVLVDPYRCDVQRLLPGLDYAWPNAPKVGGLASGGRPGAPQLFDAREVRSEGGALIAVLGGDVEMQPVVAQGCRGLGKTGTITSCREYVLRTIDDTPAFAFLEQQIASIDDDLRARAGGRAPVFLGIATDAFAGDDADDGSFLVRNVLGHDPSTGALTVGEMLRPGRRVRFMLRDRDTSSEDVHLMLAAAVDERSWDGALMFSCLGRGKGLYGESGHDSSVFASAVGDDVPLAGFFCNGEIGPVGRNDATSVHGYTSSFALLRSSAGARGEVDA